MHVIVSGRCNTFHATRAIMSGNQILTTIMYPKKSFLDFFFFFIIVKFALLFF